MEIAHQSRGSQDSILPQRSRSGAWVSPEATTYPRCISRVILNKKSRNWSPGNILTPTLRAWMMTNHKINTAQPGFALQTHPTGIQIEFRIVHLVTKGAVLLPQIHHVTGQCDRDGHSSSPSCLRKAAGLCVVNMLQIQEHFGTEDLHYLLNSCNTKIFPL